MDTQHHVPHARRSRRFALPGILGAALLGVGLVAAGLVAAGLVAAQPAGAPSAEEGARAFTEVAKVLQSPRCRNCHPSGDAPLHGDDGHPHAMNVSRLSASSGLACTTCHRARNTEFEHGPPGVPDWHMPSAETPMVFQGLSPAELCSRLKDPAKNGGKSLTALVDHVGHDPLVLWAWDPGPGRSKPPLSHAAFVAAARTWAASGGACPNK